jgi:hypothetical protein
MDADDLASWCHGGPMRVESTGTATIHRSAQARRIPCVIFDERTGDFGLATADANAGSVFVGFYGDFLTTLESM